jgi:hypothetical protein
VIFANLLQKKFDVVAEEISAVLLAFLQGVLEKTVCRHRAFVVTLWWSVWQTWRKR